MKFNLVLLQLLLFSFPLLGFDYEKLLLEWDKTYTQTFDQRQAQIRVIINECKKYHDAKGVADSYRRLGTLFIENAQMDSAISSLVISATFAESIGYTSSSASSYNQLGSVYYELNDLTSALTYFQRAFDLYTKAENFRGKSDAGLNLAEIQVELGNLELAEKLNLLSIIDRRIYGDTSEIGYNLDLSSRINFNKKRYQLALANSKAAVYLFTKNDDITGLLPGIIQLGDCYEKLKLNDSSFKYYKQSYLLSRQYEFKKWIVQSALSLAKTFELMRLPDSANTYLKIYASFKDSLLNESIANAAINAATRYETKKKDLEIQSQKERSQLMQQQLIILIVLLLSLLLALFFIVRYFRQQKKLLQKESELNNTNAILRGQDEERERIARELHDSVGGMISNVKLHFSAMEQQMSSLIKKQGQSYEKAISLLDETYEEVRRISRDLDTGILGRFGLRTAMLQMAQLISSTNKLKVQYIDNNLEPEVYKAFETDLYRITQELLSNSIKYAHAKEISVQISSNNGTLVYSYEDDGVGFLKDQLLQAKGLGYKNIEARVNRMKGQWHLDTSPGNGLNLIIELPLSEK